MSQLGAVVVVQAVDVVHDAGLVRLHGREMFKLLYYTILSYIILYYTILYYTIISPPPNNKPPPPPPLINDLRWGVRL